MTTSTYRATSAFSVLLLCGVLTAQTNFSLTSLTRFTSTLQQSRHIPCTLLPGCPAPGLPPTAAFAAGGNAYDGTDKNHWATSGQVLAKYAGPTACTIVCPPGPCPKSSPAANASGLDVVESLGQLWIVDDLGWLTQATTTCPPTIVSQCAIALLPGDQPTGVAVDDGRGIVFYTTLNATGSRLYVAPITAPCAPFSVTPLLDCFSNPVPSAGCAADWGTSTLYWTDGRGTYSFPYNYNPAGPSITFGPPNCCITASPNDPYVDLTLQPRGENIAGNPCSNGTCPTCPNIHSLRTGPILGSTIQFGLDQAPVGALSILALNIGFCTTGAPTIPPLCGPLLLPPGPPATLPFLFTTGSGACGGSATYPWSVPAAPPFAGLPIASQVLMLCGGGTGTALSNCIDFVLLGV